MPKVFQFYFKHVAIGALVSALFIGLILYFNVANLWHLISTSDIGWLALLMFWALNTSVFAGVQFGVAVMMMAEEDDDGPRRGTPATVEAVPAVVVAPRQS